jgi:Adipokinetic hormone
VIEDDEVENVRKLLPHGLVSFVVSQRVSLSSELKIYLVFLTSEVIFATQLTFTPSWGKRGGAPTQAAQNMFGDTTNNNVPQTMCNPKMDSLVLIFRLIQNEAQKMLECNSQQK